MEARGHRRQQLLPPSDSSINPAAGIFGTSISFFPSSSAGIVGMGMGVSATDLTGSPPREPLGSRSPSPTARARAVAIQALRDKRRSMYAHRQHGGSRGYGADVEVRGVVASGPGLP